MLLQVFSRYWRGHSSLMYNFALIAFSIGCGTFSYMFIEMPTIKYRRHLRNKNTSWTGPKENMARDNPALPAGSSL